MAATKVGINGFGRIGRQVLRAIMERQAGKIEVVAINDLADAKTNAHLFKYDTNYGRFPGEVTARGDQLVINGKAVKVFGERDPGKLPWGSAGVEIVVESTGFFTNAEKAKGHLQGGARKVIISAPATGEDLTVVLGVNDQEYNASKHTVISNASCTTNCIAPMVKVLHDGFHIERGLMSTIHSYTNDQKILDQVHDDLRRARAAAQNIIPTTTGAARAVTKVIPALKGKIDGMAYRVPTSTVSVTDFTATVGKETSVAAINAAFQKASESGSLKGILGYSEEPLVSVDYKGNPSSCTLDALSTAVVDGNLVKIVGWYDNEWGYACRTADLAALVAAKGV
ncbi:MAG: type I glyceraldehyde-3-phosphate dehydrogenase [SAR202 cluster bacterium]|nr:type I glyceraldehyde-3-phosphate dehydrogenase [SAR202 cluster bacterium]